MSLNQGRKAEANQIFGAGCNSIVRVDASCFPLYPNDLVLDGLGTFAEDQGCQSLCSLACSHRKTMMSNI